MNYPSDVEIEKDLIGLLIGSSHLLPDCDFLSPNHFFDSDHKAIWACFNSLKHSWSLSSLKHKLTEPQYEVALACAKRVVSISLLKPAVETIRILALKRAILVAAKELTDISCVETDQNKLLGAVDTSIGKVRELEFQGEDRFTLNNILERMRKTREDKKNKKYKDIRIGYAKLDSFLDGLKPGGLHVIAARPGMGKTSFAINIIYKLFISRIPILFLTLEMTSDQICHRIMGLMNMRNYGIYSGNYITDDEYEEAEKALYAYKDSLYLYDESPLHIDKIFVIARRFVVNYGVKAIFIDYLQLIRSSRKDNKTAEVTEISNKLKDMAKNLGVPVICLSQLNRDCDRRENKRPSLSDLRESGSIEQDADSVIFLYSDDYYNGGDKKEMNVEVLLRKNRHGPTGTEELKFDMEKCRFDYVL